MYTIPLNHDDHLHVIDMVSTKVRRHPPEPRLHTHKLRQQTGHVHSRHLYVIAHLEIRQRPFAFRGPHPSAIGAYPLQTFVMWLLFLRLHWLVHVRTYLLRIKLFQYPLIVALLSKHGEWRFCLRPNTTLYGHAWWRSR